MGEKSGEKNEDFFSSILDEEPLLTAKERAELRRLLEHDRRAHWLWALFRNFAVAIAGIVGFLAGVKHLFGLDIKGLSD